MKPQVSKKKRNRHMGYAKRAMAMLLSFLVIFSLIPFSFLSVSAAGVTGWNISTSSDGKYHITGTITLSDGSNHRIGYDERYWISSNVGGSLSTDSISTTWLNSAHTQASFDFSFWVEEVGTQTIWVNIIDQTDGKYNGYSKNFTITPTEANRVPEGTRRTPGHLVYTLQPGNSTITYSVWTGYSNGSPITDYRVMWSTDQKNWEYKILATRPNGTQSGNITGLKNGTAYYVKFQATNAKGTSSTTTYTVTPGTATAPQNFWVDSGNASQILRWKAPADLRGGTVQKYQIAYSADFSSIATEVGASTYSWTRTGLTNGQIYNVTYYIRAVTQYGAGASVAASIGNFYTGSPAQMSAPTVKKASGTNRNYTVSWTAPSNNGSAITGYKIYKGGKLFDTISSGSTLTKTYTWASGEDNKVDSTITNESI